MSRTGLLAQLREPPGGRDAKTMLTAQFLDRTGTGVWNATGVLYFTIVAGFDARRIGLMLGAGGVAGVLGSPVAGRLAARYSVRSLLTACHLLRLVTLCVIVSVTAFGVLQAAVALTIFGDRAAKTLEMLFAAEVAGPERATYQALFRSVANAGYALGAGIAAIGLAIGSRDVYRVLIGLDALSFAAISLLLRRIPGGAPARPAPASAGRTDQPGTASPWRDPGYLGFVLLDIVMTTDDPVLNVGLPLWLLTRTKAPHALVPGFLIVNTVLVVVLQMRVSAATNGPRDAAKAVGRYGLIMLACCACLAAAAECGALLASVVLLTAAALQTLAELMRSVSSWELAVSLAPVSARPAYLGVAGISQSVQKSAGPLALTDVVMAAGPVGWLLLGGVVAGLSVRQRRGCLRKLASSVHEAAHNDNGATLVAGYSGRPQAAKLGLKPGMRLALTGRPGNWDLTDPPDDLADAGPADAPADVIIAFCRAAAELDAQLPGLAKRIFPAGAIWVAWPRRAAGHHSDITDNVIREIALPLGLVDVKVAAIDDDWSGLRLVWRVVNRGG